MTWDEYAKRAVYWTLIVLTAPFWLPVFAYRELPEVFYRWKWLRELRSTAVSELAALARRQEVVKFFRANFICVYCGECLLRSPEITAHDLDLLAQLHDAGWITNPHKPHISQLTETGYEVLRFILRDEKDEGP